MSECAPATDISTSSITQVEATETVEEAEKFVETEQKVEDSPVKEEILSSLSGSPQSEEIQSVVEEQEESLEVEKVEEQQVEEVQVVEEQDVEQVEKQQVEEVQESEEQEVQEVEERKELQEEDREVSEPQVAEHFSEQEFDTSVRENETQEIEKNEESEEIIETQTTREEEIEESREKEEKVVCSGEKTDEKEMEFDKEATFNNFNNIDGGFGGEEGGSYEERRNEEERTSEETSEHEQPIGGVISDAETVSIASPEPEQKSVEVAKETPIARPIVKSGIRPPAVRPPTRTPLQPRTAPSPQTPNGRIKPPTTIVHKPTPVRPQSAAMPRPPRDITPKPAKTTSRTSLNKSVENVGRTTPKVNVKYVAVQSKVGSVTSHKPGGGNVEIFSEKRTYAAKSKVGSLDNASHVAGGGNIRIESRKLDFTTAKPKIESQSGYVPAKPDVKIVSEKLTWNAASKVGSMDNTRHKPTGGNVKADIESTRPNVLATVAEVVARPVAVRATPIDIAKKSAAPIVARHRKSVSARSSSNCLLLRSTMPGAIYPLTAEQIFSK